MNRTLLTTLLGALGGFLGFLLAEFLGGDHTAETALGAIGSTALWTALVMLPLTLVLGAADNVLGLRGPWWRGLGRAAVPTVLLGLFAGALAQVFYGLGLALGVPQRLIRALAWGLLGGGVGLVLGLLDRSWSSAGRGLLGGAVGGFLGGLLFDSFAGLSSGENDSGRLARLVGLTLLGAAIGFMLRLSQELFKTSWLLGTTTGHYEGQQYILSKAAVTVGSAPHSDLRLHHDRDVLPLAGTLHRQPGQGWHWEGEGALVNGRPARSTDLRHGDRLRLGNTELLFQEKGGAAPGQLFTPPLMLHSNEQAVPLPTPFKSLTLGSAGDVSLRGPGIAARHAVIEAQGETLTLRALAPLRLNDQAVAAGTRAPLRPGDLLTLGQTEFALLRV